MKRTQDVIDYTRGRKYVGRINELLDAIQFYDLADFSVIINELDKFAAIDNSAGAAVVVRQDITQTQSLQNLYDLYLDAEDNVFPEDLENFKSFFIHQVGVFTQALKAGTSQENLQRINEQEQQRIEREARKNAKQQLDVLGVKKQQIQGDISAEQYALMEKYEIALTTNLAEVAICIKIKELMSKISDADNYLYTEQELLELERLHAEIWAMLNVQNEENSTLDRTALLDYKETIANFFMLFNGSRITLADFNNKLNAYQQSYVLAVPNIVTDIDAIAEPDTMFFFIKVVHLVWLLRSLQLREELNETDQESKTYIWKTKQEILQEYVKLCAEYLDLNLVIQDPDFSLIAQRLENIAEIVCKILIPYTIPLRSLVDRDENFLITLSKEQERITALVTNRNTNFATVFALPDHWVLALLTNVQDVSLILDSTEFTLADIINLPVNKLEVLLESATSMQRLMVLLNYFHLTKQQVIAIPDWADILNYPIKAVQIFNTTNKRVTIDHLDKELNNILEQATDHATALTKNRYLIKLKDISSLPKTLLKNLQTLGLDFYRCQAIYEILVKVNQEYTKTYVDKFTGKGKSHKKLTFDEHSIKLLFSAEQANIIFKFLHAYTKMLQHKMPPAKIHFTKGILQSQNPDEYTKLPYDYIDPASAMGENQVFKAIERSNLAEVTELLNTSYDVLNFSSKGLSYYSIAVKSKNNNLINLLKSKIEQHTKATFKDFCRINGFHAGHINSMNTAGELPLSLAIKQNHVDLITLLLLKGAKVNLIDGSGATALQLVLSAQTEQFIEELLYLGANEAAFGSSRLRLPF